MDAEDDDIHICLVCQATVAGLVNYVNHKKFDCPGRKNNEKEKKVTNQHRPMISESVSPKGTSTEQFMQLLSSPNNLSQSQLFSSHLETSANQSPSHILAMSTSPSHSIQFSTQITFSEEIGPIMSLTTNSNPDLLTLPVSSESNGNLPVNQSMSHDIVSTASSLPTQSVQALPVGLDVNEQLLSISSSGFSQSNNIVTSAPSAGSDFFSSLALQKKIGKDGRDQSENKDSLTADLPISNILNNLDLYDEDLDFVFSDDDFLKDAFTDESDDDNIPPPNYTHGKWKPGEGPSYHSKVVMQPGKRPMHPSRGKWRPGEMPARGKLQSHILARENEKAKAEETKMKIRKGNRKRDEYNCQYCDITFTNRFLYSNHCMRKEHKANVAQFSKIKKVVEIVDDAYEKHQENSNDVISNLNEEEESKKENKTKNSDLKSSADEKLLKSSDNNKNDSDEIVNVKEGEVEEEPVHFCVVCDKRFNNKYIMARHLLSTYHKNRTKGHPDAIKVLEQYHKYIVWLSPYQCTICQFYFNRRRDFIDHINSNDHKIQCESLDGEIMCSICKYSCHDNTSLLKHLEKDSAHALATKKGNKPCIIKERNYDAECKFCKKKLHSKLHMKRHMRAQHFKEYEEYESSCKLCNKSFFDSYTYNRHMATGQHRLRSEQKKKYGRIEPEEEPEVFNEGVIRTHINRKVEKPYKLAKKSKNPNKSHKCDYCDFVAMQYDELRPHYLEKHANHVFVCELCDLTFITEKARKVHFAGIKHQTNLKRSEGNTNSIVEQCDYCDRRFEDELLKLFHTEVYHLHPNSEESLREKLGHEDITAEKYRDFLASVDGIKDERVQCLECPKTIMKDYILEHLRSHSGDKPYKCRYCSSGFAAPLSLRRHLMSHVGLADRKCEICGKEFKKFGSYREHMTKHCLEENNASRLICDVCGQSFLLQKQLNTHMRRHGEKKFKCEFPNCRWSFFLYNELKAHHRSHTGERTYLCDICGYAAGTKNRLNRHHRTHTGVRDHHCEYCNYKAGTRTHLRRHMRIHIGSKPYKCPYCSYSCNTHENIRKHISKTKKHAGLPIYPCKFCSYGTSNTIDFRFHLEQMHKGEFNFKASDGLAIIAGLYRKDDDPDKPMEGTEIIQVKERKVKNPRQRPKQKKISVDQAIAFEIQENKYGVVQYQGNIQENKVEIIEYQDPLQENKGEIAEYRENHEDFPTTIIDVNVTEWPPNYTAENKMTPRPTVIHAYQQTIEPIYSGQMSSVGYFMPATTTPSTVSVDSGLIPQPPALQVDVVANSYKWQYE